MTRLVDVERLVAYFERLEGDTIAVTDAAAVADNMPTVCCAACVHGETARTSDGVEVECQRDIGPGVSSWNKPGFGCSYFERRQP